MSRKIVKHPPLTKAQQKLVSENYRFVYQIAKSFNKLGHEADLISEGFVGLCIAATKFNKARGFKFTTYSAYWIKAYMFGYLLKTHGQMHIVSTHRKLYFKILKAQNVLREVGGEDEITAIANEVSADRKIVEMLLSRVRNHDLMLDSARRTAYDGELRSQIEMVDRKPLPEQSVADVEEGAAVQARVQWALGFLTERERHIIESRDLADKPCTLKALGEQYGLSRERVRQIEKLAYDKLRKRLQTGLPPPRLASAMPAPTTTAAPTATVPHVRARRA